MASYPLERRIKLSQLKELISHTVSHEKAAEVEIVGDEDFFEHYRNKIVLHVTKDHGETFLGYVGRKQSETVDIDECLLAQQPINELLSAERAKAGFAHSLHAKMDVTFRCTPSSGAMMWRNNPPKNSSYLKEEMPFGILAVPAGGFAQVNPRGAALLVNLVEAELTGLCPATVVDAYAGAGLFAVVAAIANVPNIIAIEADKQSAEAAGFNLQKYATNSTCRVITADAAEALSEILSAIPPNGVLVVDPPRDGLSPKAAAVILQSPLQHAIYISCNMATLGRDLRRFQRAGFTVDKVRMVDMFPRSSHFEVFTVLSRKVD